MTPSLCWRGCGRGYNVPAFDQIIQFLHGAAMGIN
jgi:hypothetical protein